MTYAHRMDDSQREIADALRTCGVYVRDMSWCGRGVLDLFCWYQGEAFWVECKSGKRPLTPAEVKFMREYPGDAYILRSVDDALALVQQRRVRVNTKERMKT